MKLIKYLFFILVLIGSLIFLVKLNELNSPNGELIHVKIPFTQDRFEDGINIWIVMVSTFSAGVILGFIIALIQLIAQKREVISLRSTLRKLQSELDSLRNQSIEDDIAIDERTESIDL
jgi:hypothetical protein